MAWAIKGLAFWYFFLVLAGVAINAGFPVMYKFLFDFLEKQLREGAAVFSWRTFYIIFAVYIILSIFKIIIDQLSNYYGDKWWLKSRNKLALRVFKHLESLSISFFEKEPTGKVIERTSQGISDVQMVLSNVMVHIVPQFIFILVAMYILFRVNIYFGLIILVGMPIFIFISLRYAKKLNKYQDKVRDASERKTSIYVETISNIKTVKSFTTEKRQLALLKKFLERHMFWLLLRTKKIVILNVVRRSITDISQIIILGLGAYWTVTGKMTIGTLIMAWTYVMRSYEPLWSLTWRYDEILKDMRSVRRVFHLLDTEPEIKDVKDAASLENVKGAIEFKNIEFKYKNRKVIKNINLSIPKGQVVAIVGKSGVGKSTIIKLLLRFYDPQKGQVLIDGQDIKEVTQDSLRRNIGVVLQDTAIFNDTIYNNIAYAKEKTTVAEVTRAAKVANIHNFIKALPKGYETVAGERGIKLSGGEQQRINIARAVLKNPPVLVLDEATSHLDSENEQLIQEALWKLIEGKTSIIIAHRLSTIMRADLIVVFDKGKISEMGTHDELVKKKGIYNKLFEIQSGGYLK